MCQPSKTHRANTQDRMSDSSSKKPSLHPASPACSARSQPRRWRFKLFAAVFLTAVFRFSSLFEKVFHKSSQPYYFQKLLIMRHTRNISRQLCSCRWQTKRNLIRTIRSGSKAHRQHQANLIMAAVDRQAGGPGNIATDVEDDDEVWTNTDRTPLTLNSTLFSTRARNSMRMWIFNCARITFIHDAPLHFNPTPTPP
jgi:hypothetical protein